MADQTHPHEIIGSFVKYYDKYIKPEIEEGDISLNTKITIQNCDYKLTNELIVQGNIDAGAEFKAALVQLKHLCDCPNDETSKSTVNIRISKIETILGGDEIYDKHRKDKVA